MLKKEEIISFTESFFKNLNCNSHWQDKTLIVENVPPAFEKFAGKSSPYHLVFSLEDQSPDTELISKGHYLLTAMTKFLDTAGQTSLQKINFTNSLQDLLEIISFKNATLLSSTKRETPNLMFRFNFQTTLQYLNKKDKILSPILIANNQISSLDLDKYELIEGKRKDLPETKIDSEYALAKSHLKSLLQPKIEEVSLKLKQNLESEMERIKSHSSHQLKEIEEQLVQNDKKILELKHQIEKSPDKEPSLTLKIKKLEESSEKVRASPEFERIKQEEEFLIKSEIQKHAINIDNKLINSSIIYYPTIIFTINLKHKIAHRSIDISLDPLKKQIHSVNCETCNTELQNIFLCSSGHICCQNCFHRCKDCNTELCAKCFTKKCNYCNHETCRSCSSPCSTCGKPFCKVHSTKNSLTGQPICFSCSSQCDSCHGIVPSTHLKLSPPNKKLCEKCFRESIKSNTISNVFRLD